MIDIKSMPPEDLEFFRQKGYTDEQIAQHVNPPPQAQPQDSGKMSAVEAAIARLKAGAGGIAGGGAGALAGGEAGALAGGALGTVVPVIGNAIGAGVGGITGAIIGGLGGGALGQKVQQSVLPADVQAQLEEEAAKAQQQHPWVSAGTDITAGALASGGAFSPTTPLKALAGDAKAIRNVALQAGVIPAINTGVSLVSGEPITAGGIAQQMVGGALFAKPSTLGRWASGFHKEPTADPLGSTKEGDNANDIATTPDTLSLYTEKGEKGYSIDDASIKKMFMASIPKPTPPADAATNPNYHKALTTWKQQTGIPIDEMRQILHERHIAGAGAEPVQEPLQMAKETPTIKVAGTEMTPAETTVKPPTISTTGQEAPVLPETPKEEMNKREDVVNAENKQSLPFADQEGPNKATDHPENKQTQQTNLNPEQSNLDRYLPSMVERGQLLPSNVDRPAEKPPTLSEAKLSGTYDPMKRQRDNTANPRGDNRTDAERIQDELEGNGAKYSEGKVDPKDLARFEELRKARVAMLATGGHLTPEGNIHPEYLKNWSESEKIKNKYGGKTPDSVKGEVGIKPAKTGTMYKTEATPVAVADHINSGKATTGSVMKMLGDSQGHPFQPLARWLWENMDSMSRKVKWNSSVTLDRSAYHPPHENEIGLPHDEVNMSTIQTYHAPTVIEEAIHSMTSAKLPKEWQGLRGAELYEKMLKFRRDNPEHPVSQLVTAYLNTAKHLGLHDSLFAQHGLSGDPDAVKSAMMGDTKGYALGDLHEFIAHAFKNKEFQEMLNKIPAGDSSNKTMWQRVVDAISHLLGIPVQQKMMLDHVLRHSAELITRERDGSQGTGNIARLTSEYGLVPQEGALGRKGWYTTKDPAFSGLSVHIDDNAIHLVNMEAAEKGKGAGTAMLDRLKSLSDATGKSIKLTAESLDTKTNPRLEKFYEKNGFVRDAEGKNTFTYKGNTKSIGAEPSRDINKVMNLFGFKGKVDLTPIGLGSGEGKIAPQHLEGALANKLGRDSAEFRYLKENGLDNFLFKARSQGELEKWMDSIKPKVEVRKFGGDVDATPEKEQRVRELQHRFDTINPNWREGAEFRHNIPQADLSEYQRLHRELSGGTFANTKQTHWGFVAPKAEKDMPGYVEWGLETEGNKALPRPHKIPPYFGRGYMENVNGEKIFHVIEAQQDVVDKDNSTGEFFINGHPELGRFKSFGDAAAVVAKKIDPLFPSYERLILKAAIDHARQEGATKIAISDAETAMMSEGHDRAAATPPRTYEMATTKNGRTIVDQLNEGGELYTLGNERGFNKKAYLIHQGRSIEIPIAEVKKLADNGVLELNPEAAQNSYDTYWKLTPEYKAAEPVITQEQGMRLHYDRTLPKIAEELTGSKGERVEMGEHKMSKKSGSESGADLNEIQEAVERQQRGEITQEELDRQLHEISTNRTRKDLIFRNPDGTPKTSVTARVYDISGKNPETMTMFGKRHSEPITEEQKRLAAMAEDREDAANLHRPANTESEYQRVKDKTEKFDTMRAAVHGSEPVTEEQRAIANRSRAVNQDLESTSSNDFGKFKKAFGSVLDNIRAIPHEGAKHLADAYQRALDYRQKLTGKYTNPVVAAGKNLSRGDKIALNKAIEDYMTKKIAMPEGLSPEAKNFFKTAISKYREFADEHIANNIPIMDSNGNMRLMKKQDFKLPTMANQNVENMFRKGEDLQGMEKAKKEYLDYHTKVLGKTIEEAQAAFKDWRASITGNLAGSGISHQDYFNAIRRAMGDPLPPTWREQDPVRNMQRYFDRAGMAMAHYAKVENNPKALAALGAKKNAWGNAIPQYEEGGIASNKYAQAAVSQFHGAPKDTTQQTEEGASSLATALFIASPGLEIHKVGSNFIKAALYAPNPYQAVRAISSGIMHMRDGWTHSVEGGLTKLTAASAADMFDNSLNTHQRMAGVAKLVRGISTLGELTTKANAAFQQAYFEHLLPTLVTRANAGDKTAARMLKHWDTDYKVGKSYSTKDIQQLASTAASYVHGTGDIRQMPAWMMNEGEISGFMQLAHWSVAQTNNFMHDVYLPATKGNYTPLVMGLFGSAVGGYIIKELREEVQGKKGQIPSLKEIAASEKGLQGNVPLVVYNMIAGMQYAGFGGLFSQVAKYPFDAVYKNSLQSATFPLDEVASDIAETAHQVVTAMANDPNVNYVDLAAKVAQHVFGSNIKLASIALNQGINNGLVTGLPAEKKLLADKLGQLRRFDMVSGIPYNEVDAGSNPFMNIEQQKFKMEQDPTKAVQMLPKLISNIMTAYHDNPDVMMEKIKALKQNSYSTFPSMENTPLSFYKYLGYLQREEGPQAAQAALQDYMKHKVVNEVKSSVVP